MNELSPIAGIGHNLPPLSDQLVEETEALKQRAEDLAGAVSRAAVSDDETAGKATLLAKMITTHRGDIDKARIARKEPFLEGGRAVDSHFKSIDSLLAQVDGKGKVIGGPLADLMGKIDAYRREQERKAAEERRRLEEEARKQREAAEAAERARREAEQAAAAAQSEAEAAKAREAALAAELESRKAAEQAAAAAQQAEQTAATQIDSGFGAKAHGRKVRTAVITDWTAAGKHAWGLNPDALKEAIQKIYDAQVRAGVKSLPGAHIDETTETRIR